MIVFMFKVKAALSKGEDVNSRDEENRTTLYMAVLKGDISMVKLLLKQPGIDVNNKESNGRTVLHIAVLQGNVKIVHMLLSNNGVD